MFGSSGMLFGAVPLGGDISIPTGMPEGVGRDASLVMDFEDEVEVTEVVNPTVVDVVAITVVVGIVKSIPFTPVTSNTERL